MNERPRQPTPTMERLHAAQGYGQNSVEAGRGRQAPGKGDAPGELAVLLGQWVDLVGRCRYVSRTGGEQEDPKSSPGP